MPFASLDDLFHTGLRDMYYAEKKLLRVLPKMAKAAGHEELAEAFDKHHTETESHVERLEKVFEIIEAKPRAKKCPAMDGLVEEGTEVLEGAEEEAVKDAGLLAAGQAVEHYEIARYGTLIAWAKQMDQSKIADLLMQNLKEEKAAEELLSSLAESVNEIAMSNKEAKEEEGEED